MEQNIQQLFNALLTTFCTDFSTNPNCIQYIIFTQMSSSLCFSSTYIFTFLGTVNYCHIQGIKSCAGVSLL